MTTMKLMTTLAALCLGAALIGCSSTQSSTSAGAMGAEKACCKDGKSACCKDKAAAPGAMGAEKAACSKTCPASKDAVAPGAVGAESKPGCCSKGAK
jgi:hypothetical protein